MSEPTTRVECARELLNSLNIPSYELGDLIGIRGARVSDFKTGKQQPATLENKIADAVYRIQRAWDGLGHSFPLCDLENAEAKLEYIKLLENSKKNQTYRARLEAELAKRTSASTV